MFKEENVYRKMSEESEIKLVFLRSLFPLNIFVMCHNNVMFLTLNIFIWRRFLANLGRCSCFPPNSNFFLDSTIRVKFTIDDHYTWIGLRKILFSF